MVAQACSFWRGIHRTPSTIRPIRRWEDEPRSSPSLRLPAEMCSFAGGSCCVVVTVGSGGVVVIVCWPFGHHLDCANWRNAQWPARSLSPGSHGGSSLARSLADGTPGQARPGPVWSKRPASFLPSWKLLRRLGLLLGGSSSSRLPLASNGLQAHNGTHNTTQLNLEKLEKITGAGVLCRCHCCSSSSSVSSGNRFLRASVCRQGASYSSSSFDGGGGGWRNKLAHERTSATSF